MKRSVLSGSALLSTWLAVVDQWSAHGSTADHSPFTVSPLLAPQTMHSHQKPWLSPFPPSSNFPFPWTTFTLWFSPCSFPFCHQATRSARHICAVLTHFPIAPLSIYHAGFSTSAASHKHTLASTFSALISSSSHQSPSGLTAATSDPSVHASLSHSLPLFPPQSSLCLSQSILPLENRQTPRRWHHQGMEEVGWSAPLNHFAPQLLVKEATDSVAVDQEDWKSPPTCDLLDTGDKNNPYMWPPSYQKDTLCFFTQWKNTKKFLCFYPSIGVNYSS